MCDYKTGLKCDLGIRESDRKNNKVVLPISDHELTGIGVERYIELIDALPLNNIVYFLESSMSFRLFIKFNKKMQIDSSDVKKPFRAEEVPGGFV